MFEEYTRWPRISDEAIHEVESYLRAGKTSLDTELLELFEAELGRYFGVAHALTTCNGTSAAFSAFFALGLTQGDDIIAPCYTHWATVLPALHVGCNIIFADVEPNSLSISVDAVQKKITDKTKAIVVCHLYGNPVDIVGLRRLCDEYKLYLIEDISHAPGATVNGQKVGSFGDIAFASFQGTKMISAGEGGALFTNNFEHYARAMELGHPKRIASLPARWQTYNRVGLGHKFRLNAISALIAYYSFKGLSETIAIRHDMFQCLHAVLDDFALLQTAAQAPGASRVYFRWEFFLTLNLEPVLKALRPYRLEIHRANYEFLPHLPHFKATPSAAEVFPNAEKLLNTLVLFHPFTMRNQEAIEAFADLIRKVLIREANHEQ